MIDLELLHDTAQVHEGGNKRLLEDIFNIDSDKIFIVYFYDRYGVDILKAFKYRKDAEDYQRHYLMINFEKCHIWEISLE